MPNNKEPCCPYGNKAIYVCVNSQCKNPGFTCEKGESTQSECSLFHETCQKIKWSQVQTFAKQNSLAQTPEFKNLQDKIENLFLKTLEKIQFEHQKFKIWSKTYGHSLESMKFIKYLMDKNYEQISGQYMSTVIPDLLNKQSKKIQNPNIIQSDFQLVRKQLDKVLENFSALYLKGKRVSRILRHSDPNDALNTSNSAMQSALSMKSQKSERLIASKQLNSKILSSLSKIEKYFQGRTIRKATLMYRATQNNFSTKRFHELCDNIPNTLTLIKNQFGKVIGGYTPVQWKSEKKQWIADKTLKSFIFSIDMNQKFNLNLAQFAIASNPEKGPTFGCCDITIADNGNRDKSNCQFPISYNNNGKYVRSQQTSTLFTGHAKGQFLIHQWQIFCLQFQ